jgi:3-dehydroquinate synthase
VARIRDLLRRAGLPDSAPDLGVEAYLKAMEIDKKVEDGKIRFVLLRRIGEAFISGDVPTDHLAAALKGYVQAV